MEEEGESRIVILKGKKEYNILKEGIKGGMVITERGGGQLMRH